jgi:hypothetical protein
MESLLQQIALLHHMTPESIGLMEECKSRGGHLSLDEVTDVLQMEIKSHSSIFIVVDALDEIAEENCGNMLSRLYSLANDTPARLMVTSQDLPSIKQSIQPDITLGIVAQNNDIAHYVQAEICHKGPTLKQYLSQNPLKTEEIVEKDIEMVQGM